MIKHLIKTLILVVIVTGVLSCNTTSYYPNEEIASIEAPFAMKELRRPDFPDRVFIITDFGAIEDGTTLNHTAFSTAINSCSEQGGGTVLVPEGKWLTVPIELKSNVNLHLQEGAEVLFTYEKSYFFPDSASRARGDLTRPISPIYAKDAENIAITGPGILDGQGVGWWPLQEKWWTNHKIHYSDEFYEEVWRGINRNVDYDKDLENYMDDQSNYGDNRPVAVRPSMLKPINCKNILLEGFTIKNSPMWTINPVMCENIIIRRLTIRAETGYDNPHTPNTDGINPESSKNVLIEYCNIITGDDSFAVKSGLDEAGRKRGIPSENIVIRHCTNRRISIGSEMSGGIRNVYVHDCNVIGGMNRAIHIKTVRGRGGVVENLWFENIHFDTVKENAIFVNMYYGDREEEPVTERTPQFRNFHFKNISGKMSERPVAVMGIPEMPAENIFFENIDIKGLKGLLLMNCRGVQFNNTVLDVMEGAMISVFDGWDMEFNEVQLEKEPSTFMEVSGSRSGNIQFPKELSEMKRSVVYGPDAGSGSVEFSMND